MQFIRGIFYFFFQDPIGRELRTTVRIKRSFSQMCCIKSLVCPRSRHIALVNSERVVSPQTCLKQEYHAKCGVRAVIRFIYSEQATRNVVFRHCPSSWQWSAAYCSCNNEAPEAFSMGSVWSSTFIRPDLAPCDFHLFPRMKQGRRRTNFGTMSCRPA